jgi:predicted RNA-binding Zn ribbon-like protein
MGGYPATELGRRAPAPGELGIVQRFLNSVDIESGDDALATTERASRWLREHGLSAAGPLDEGDRVRLVAFREALRDVLDARSGPASGDTRGGEAELALARLARGAPLVVDFGPDAGARLEPAGSGVEAIVGRILAAIVASTADGTWARLKICRNDACRWSFYDASRNRSGHWCSMAICGNRMKGRAFRLRRGWPSDEVPAL